MRQVQLHEDEEQFASLISEAEAGESLTILRAGRPVAQIIPFPAAKSATETPQLWSSEEERQAAGERLFALMDKGFDLGGLKIKNRDELYTRE